MKYFAGTLLILTGLTTPFAAAQHLYAANQSRSIDFAGGFTAIHANASPANCGCFLMYGGDAQISVGVTYKFRAVLDYGQTSILDANGGGHDIHLSTFLAGGRYRPHPQARFSPYAQLLAGVGHSSTNFIIDRSTTTYAIAAGGGLDLRVSRRFSARIAQVEYLQTHVPNGVNDRQNQIRMTTGIVFHLKPVE